ncbi:methionyl-tRNA formyltransferase [Legionella worsleiensis]|uniref:Methionyl-tRNA formyltransferase n=1 Tax=Legionella worsleiensis TaxID=45076 RepID=A0A0W1A9G7_9GAMM|nr:methionyl-tRNA formyltransferase [Legionella worsleiensis]KTD77960.1 methionyl tRNA formyltransferase [Legionella worsleiensis]STY31594.1 methionyl-tRNA formyltransferase [Legionella worsleiensis]
MSGLSVVFAGTPEFGIPCLEALHQSQHHIKAVYTQPDRPAGRGRKLQASAVKSWALAQQIPVYQPLNFKNPEAIAELAALKPDVMVVIAYGLILPKAVLDIPRLGCINVHASLLPRWRGASPIQHAVLYGDEYSGVTIMQMDAGMDTGDMLAKAQCPITPSDTASSLHDKLSALSAQPLLSTLAALAECRTKPEKQNNDLATYAGKINKEDARINWHDSAWQIDCRIRAFNPWPIAYTVAGDEILRLHKAQPSQTPGAHPPGTVVHIDKKGMLVATGKNSLLVEVIQFPGGKAISIADWLNSGKTQLHAGLVLE